MTPLIISLRQLLRTPGFTAAAVGVLALGIGLNAAMFAVIHALTLSSRPFADPERVVQLYDRDTRTGDYRAFPYATYRELASGAGAFDGVLAFSATIVGLGDEDQSRRTFALLVSANYFDVLGVGLPQGRGFTAEEARPGAGVPVAIATHAFWQRTGYDPALVGRTLGINERPFTVVGITPRGFTGTMTGVGPELFFPLGVFDQLTNDFTGDARSLERPDAHALFLVGRLATGVSPAQASQALQGVAQGLAETSPGEHGHRELSIGAVPRFGASTSPTDESALTTLGILLLGMTGAVLLIVCLNLASMLLARGQGRRREFAIRLALGGRRGHIVRQLLLEGLLLSLAGGALGIVLGRSGIEWLLASLTSALPVTIAIDAGMSVALAAATLFFCGVATLGFALAPALRHSRVDLLADIKAQPGDLVRRRWRLLPRHPLVAGQVALSLGLLIAAGLFVRMTAGAASVDFGYRADDTVLAEVDSQLGGLGEDQSLDLYARVEERLGALPGVQAASVGALVPFGMVRIGRDVQRAGVDPPPGSQPATPEAGRAFDAPWNAIGAGYFDAMGLHLLQGRRFTQAETFSRDLPRVAILDEHLARRLWPDGDALGRSIQWAREDGATAAPDPMEVVGIVSGTRELFEREPSGAVYVPLAQGYMSNVFFHVRPARADLALADAVRREIRGAAPGVPLFAVRTFRAHQSGSIEYWMLRFSSALFAAFGAMAMVIALVGLYGVTAWAVARRTREIGIRIAIGAEPRAVRRLILGESLATVGGGVVIGWLLGLGIGQFMVSIFVDLGAFDPLAFMLAPVGFLAVAMGATWWPARRATRINPVGALRAD